MPASSYDPVAPTGLCRFGLPLWGCVIMLSLVSSGCSDDSQAVRSIQSNRQARQQSETQIDHLGEAFSLVSRLIELERDAANRQIIYHLNAWQQASAAKDTGEPVPSSLLSTVSDIIPPADAAENYSRDSFTAADVAELEYRYLLQQVADWVRSADQTDPLWSDWLSSTRATRGDESTDRLATAVQLFDWMVRNIALEPRQIVDPASGGPRLPLGMQFFGAGYRQTPLQTLFRGTGDGLQRSGTFIGLCRQADLPACLLATVPGGTDEQIRPWLVGVLIDADVYLFDCELGMPVIGPGQQGIATLADARRDPSVLRRMNVPGWFDYPFQRDDIQQCYALLMVTPDSISPRFQRLQQALTGDLRMAVYDDASRLVDRFESVAGIASSRIWDAPLLAQVYQLAIRQAGEQDPMLAFMVNAPWAILEGDFDQAKRLALGRWRHLQGDFDGNEIEAIEGAKALYLSQRQPEFEIADLRLDVELQKRYGIRRELGIEASVYDRQIQQVQAVIRQSKVVATFWLSLIQYDTQRFDLAETWFDQRVLRDGVRSEWDIAARYNLARTLERLDQVDRATELYRVEGSPQEHGNRLRIRAITRGSESSDQAVEN